MGKTLRTYLNVRDKSTKKKADKKRFVWDGEGYSTKAQGGVGNKRGWNLKAFTKEQYTHYKDNPTFRDDVDN